jgi:pentatricopeptide repeat protein
VLPLFSNLVALEHSKEIHERINRSEFCYDSFVGCSILDICVKCGSIKDAHNVFDKIMKQDGSLFYCNEFMIFIFVDVLSTFCHPGHVDEGLNNFGLMTTFSNHI